MMRTAQERKKERERGRERERERVCVCACVYVVTALALLDSLPPFTNGLLQQAGWQAQRTALCPPWAGICLRRWKLECSASWVQTAQQRPMLEEVAKPWKRTKRRKKDERQKKERVRHKRAHRHRGKRQRHRQTDRHTDRQTDKHTHTHTTWLLQARVKSNAQLSGGGCGTVTVTAWQRSLELVERCGAKSAPAATAKRAKMQQITNGKAKLIQVFIFWFLFMFMFSFLFFCSSPCTHAHTSRAFGEPRTAWNVSVFF